MQHDAFLPPPPRPAPGISRRALFGLKLSARARADIDYDGVAARVRAGWDRDGHEPLLRALEPVAGVAVALAGVAPGMRVLDVGAGDGNVARAALALGAEVEACDVAPAMVARGRERCPRAAWREADAQALPYPDGAFDTTISAFGAPLAPRPRRTAAELARVTRPGGTVVVAAWTPRGLPGRLAELVESERPLPAGVPSPNRWGEPDTAQARFEPHLDELQVRTRTVALEFATPRDCFDALTRAAPPLGEGVYAGFERLLASCNTAPPAVCVDARYLLITGRRPG
jgi:SAM-dependent methyltransferase